MDWHGAIALLFSFLFLNLDDDLQKTPTSFNTGRPRVPRAGKRPEHRRPGRARRGPPGDDRGHPRRGGVAAPAAGLDGAKVFFLSFFLFCFFDAPLRSPPLSPSTLFFLALFCPPPLSFSLSLHPPPPPKKKKPVPPSPTPWASPRWASRRRPRASRGSSSRRRGGGRRSRPPGSPFCSSACSTSSRSTIENSNRVCTQASALLFFRVFFLFRCPLLSVKYKK